MHLTLFSRKLSEVHKIKSAYIIINGQKKSTLNLWEYFIDNNEKYIQDTPQMLEDNYIKELLPYFQNYLNQNQNRKIVV